MGSYFEQINVNLFQEWRFPGEVSRGFQQKTTLAQIQLMAKEGPRRNLKLVPDDESAPLITPFAIHVRSHGLELTSFLLDECFVLFLFLLLLLVVLC